MIKLRSILSDRSGNVAVPGAAAIIAMIALVGGGLDVMSMSNQKSSLQDLADHAALAAVQEMAVTAQDEFRIKAIAAAYVQSSDLSIESVRTKVDLKERQVSVLLTAKPLSQFAFLNAAAGSISADATARLSGRGGNICMIGLSPVAMSTLRLRSRARITAQTCTIYSNSSSKNSVSVATTASVSADLICSVGGYQGGNQAKSYNAVEDCTPINDPLIMRKAPSIGACDFTNTVVTNSQDLGPGVYCGGLIVDGGTANLKSGEYIITGGPLNVRNNGTLNGEYVGFYLSGPGATLELDYEANVSVTAPKTGTMTGLLFFSSPFDESTIKGNRKTSGKKKPDHFIRSDNARRMVGTIYLPSGKLLIDGRDTIADKSEYTVIIADTFELQDGPNLVLRSDYHLSDIPVPEGVGPVTQKQPRLVE